MSFDIVDIAPSGEHLTEYDRELAPLYLRLLDAEAAGAPWEEAARRLLRIEPEQHRDRARLRFETHLARARWMRDVGHPQLAALPSA